MIAILKKNWYFLVFFFQHIDFSMPEFSIFIITLKITMIFRILLFCHVHSMFCMVADCDCCYCNRNNCYLSLLLFHLLDVTWFSAEIVELNRCFSPILNILCICTRIIRMSERASKNTYGRNERPD